METKQKFEGAAAILVQALGQNATALDQIVAAVNAAMLEGRQGAGTKLEQRDSLILWARETAKAANMGVSFSILRTYIANACTIAMAPGVTITKESGPKGNKSVRTIDAGNARTARDIQALAVEAGKSIGVKQRGATGAKLPNGAPPEAKPEPVDTRTPDEMKRDAFRILAEQAEEKEKQFVAMLLDAVSGKNDHLRRVADNALRGVGMRLAAIVAAAPAEVPQVLATPTIKVALSRGQKAAATRRANEARAMHAK